MVPKLHAKGSSFKGIANYVLHDKDRAQSADRVAWTEVRNLATSNPHMAWRVMAATAMDQGRLKEEAGVKKTGRKSIDTVLHMTLSWHPEQKEGLSREEMVRAANLAIHSIQASDRQALIVCHSDEPQPHVHIIINRVSSEDGRMLPSSKEKLNLSRFAEKYEKENGFIYCEERVLNNEARDRGQFTRGQKDQARNIYEAANDNLPQAAQIRRQQREKDAAVAKEVRETRARHRQQWIDLGDRHKQRIADVKNQATRDIALGKEAVRAQFRDDYRELHHERQASLAQFLRNEQSFLGRVHNVYKSIDFKAILLGQVPEGAQRSMLSGVFEVLSSSGARLEALKRKHDQAQRTIEAREKKAEKEVEQQGRETQKARLQANRALFENEHNDLLLTQKLEGAKLRADWKTRTEQRLEAWRSPAPASSAGRDQDKNARLAEKLRMIEQFRERMRAPDTTRERDHDHDRDD